jgi:L-histidine N-alpha-methyltransferase
MAQAGLLRRFIPFDVSSSAITDAAERLCERFPALQVDGVLGDFDHHIPTIPPREVDGRRMVIFLGGTIGNFHPDDRAPFLRDLRGLLRSGDSLLVGIDLVKDPAVLEAAYNDAAGVTAAFNRNVLLVMNRELGSDFVPERFTHVAVYDRENAWIEMRLRADVAQRVTVPALDMVVDFAAGEEMRTEISAKFTPQRFAAELAAAGLAETEFFTDADRQFAVAVAEVV